MSSPKFGRMTFGEGTAARRLAINSMQNIAKLGGSGDPELSEISDLLREKGDLPIVSVAKHLNWGADKAAEALERGGKLGIFVFSKDDSDTIVKLAE